VKTGDVLGQVGSSGCSTHPHLHFEITDSVDDWVDPFAADLWCAPPVYETPIQLMETWVVAGPSDQYDNPYQDPPVETDVFQVGELLVAHFVVAGGEIDDTVGVSFVGPDGSTIGPWHAAFDQVWRLSTWAWAFNVVEPRGEWTIKYEFNGASVTERTVEVQ
jgi:murein DD-endopeptidase MepM/ murein hydrolase activator NlpD